ncbi:MAG: hypothetical protein IJO24_02890 [Clostridia bacterium]|nr:hypothetical protein [Clostridia bacterium]
MQYLVEVSGEVASRKNKTYVINSSSEGNAQLIATQRFNDEYYIVGEPVSSKPKMRTKKAIVSFVLMAIAIVISFIPWFIEGTHEPVSIRPDVFSLLYSVAFYCAYFLRFKGIKQTFDSWIDVTSVVFLTLLVSTFVKAITLPAKINLFGLVSFDINPMIILIFALLLSVLGVKLASVLAFAILGMFAASQMIQLSDAMAIWGIVYVLCAFIGLGMNFSIEPAISETFSALKLTASSGMKFLSNDVAIAKSQLSGIKVTGVVNKEKVLEQNAEDKEDKKE